jgi:predicted GIY-YIG superfamily endonuclease
MSRSAPSWLATTPGEVYTLHFWPPYGDPEVQEAKHYTGWAEEGRLARRLTDHALGRGARLTQVQREAGGTWVVADVQPGTRDREQQLKERGAARRCSVCKASRDIESGKLTKEQAFAQWENATDYERSLLREIFGMEPEAPKPAPVPVRAVISAPSHEPVNYGPEVDALVDALVESWTSAKAEPALDREPEAGA